jgi:hypothetical protein
LVHGFPLLDVPVDEEDTTGEENGAQDRSDDDAGKLIKKPNVS